MCTSATTATNCSLNKWIPYCCSSSIHVFHLLTELSTSNDTTSLTMHAMHMELKHIIIIINIHQASGRAIIGMVLRAIKIKQCMTSYLDETPPQKHKKIAVTLYYVNSILLCFVIPIIVE